MKNLLKLSIVVFFLHGISVKAQTAITPSGGIATGTGGSVSYSVGQVVYTSALGSNGNIIQGVQQPYEISVSTGIENKNVNLSLSVYPNPATDYLKLQINNIDIVNCRYLLYDFKGNLIGDKKIEAAENVIIMQDISKGTYLLKVIQVNKELKTFKIIKK
jgi:hypothetical protein